MSQLTAAVTTGSPSTVASHRNRWAATVPGWIGADGRVDGGGGDGHPWVVRNSGSRSKPSSVGHHGHRLAEPDARARRP